MPTAKKAESEESQPETPAADQTPVAGEVVKHIEWGKVDSLTDARLILESHYGQILDIATEFGDGAEFMDDKSKLIGIPFVILDWRFIVDKKTQNEYASVLVMNTEGSKARFNDGSTGVYAQLKTLTERYGVTGGVQCRHGLRKSDYTTEVNGKATSATTYYLAG